MPQLDAVPLTSSCRRRQSVDRLVTPVQSPAGRGEGRILASPGVGARRPSGRQSRRRGTYGPTDSQTGNGNPQGHDGARGPPLLPGLGLQHAAGTCGSRCAQGEPGDALPAKHDLPETAGASPRNTVDVHRGGGGGSDSRGPRGVRVADGRDPGHPAKTEEPTGWQRCARMQNLDPDHSLYYLYFYLLFYFIF